MSKQCPTVAVFTEGQSLMPAFATMAADMMGREINVEERQNRNFPTLQRLVQEVEADLYLLGYPHTDQAIACAGPVSGHAEHTGGANILYRQPDGSLEAHDTRPQGLQCALKHLQVPIKGGRVLVIGKLSPAFAAALCCKWMLANEIQILNAGPFGDQDQGWKGIEEAGGKYDLIIKTQTELWPANFADQLERHVHQDTVVIDQIYHPRETSFLAAARKIKVRSYGGILSAALRTSFALWRLFEETPNEQEFVQAVQQKYGFE